MLRRALSVVLASLAAAMALSAPAAAAVRVEPPAMSASAQADLAALINSYRAASALQQVSLNGTLTAAATWMANDMAAHDYVGHTSSDGRSPTQRMSAFGYPATNMYTGEDLGAGYGSASGVLAAWQASAAHNAVLLNPNYDAVGIGLIYNPASTYKWYWAADFGGPGGRSRVLVPAAVVRAPRGAETPATAEHATDPDAEAEAARIAFEEAVGARRMAHLFAVLERMGLL
jgi:uncharacterized protein YkwD